LPELQSRHLYNFSSGFYCLYLVFAHIQLLYYRWQIIKKKIIIMFSKYFNKLSMHSSNLEVVTFFKQTQLKTSEAYSINEKS